MQSYVFGKSVFVYVVLKNRATRAIKANTVHGARGNSLVVNGMTEACCVSNSSLTGMLKFVLE